MAIQSLAETLEATSFSVYLAESAWAFPTVETIHVIFLVLVVGSIYLVDLRLVGLAPRTRSVRALTHDLLPLTWIGFALAALTGAMMFVSRATSYIENTAFLIKVVLLVLAAANMLFFHFGAYRTVAAWDVDVMPPPLARLAGALSLLLWTAVIVAGRWIGFL